MDQVFQILGACLVLAAFVAAQVRVLDQQGYPYLLLNAIEANDPETGMHVRGGVTVIGKLVE